MKRISLISLIVLICLCGIFLFAYGCKNVDIKDESGSSNIDIVETDTDLKIKIAVSKSEFSYAEIYSKPTIGMKVYGEDGGELKVNVLSGLEDETGKIVYGNKTITYEAVNSDGKKVVFTRDIVVNTSNRPEFAAQTCDLAEVAADYAQREQYGIDIGYTDLVSVLYNDKPVAEEEYSVILENETAAMSKKAVFIGGRFLQSLGTGEKVFEVVTSFGYNDYKLNVKDEYAPRYTFDKEMDNNYILDTIDKESMPKIVQEENCYQIFEADYGLYYEGREVDEITKTGKYEYRITIKKQGFSNETKSYSFYYLSEKSREVFLDPVFSEQFKNNYKINPSNLSPSWYALSFVEDNERPYYLHQVNDAYSEGANGFVIDNELIRKSLENGLTTISVDLRVAEESALSTVKVKYYTKGNVVWKTSEFTIDKDKWTTISVDLSTIKHWADSSIKGYTVDENGNVQINFNIFAITADYGPNASSAEQRDISQYSLMISNIRMGERADGISGYWGTQDGNDLIKFEEGKVIFEGKGLEPRVYNCVRAYANGMIKLSETDDIASIVLGEELFVNENGEIEYNGKIYTSTFGNLDDPYMYDCY